MASFTLSDIKFSLEVYPPKTEAGRTHLMETLAAYSSYQPSIITVTFGAGGSGRSVAEHRAIMNQIASSTRLPVAAHMICGGRSRFDVDELVDSFYQDGVRYIVALRGDIMTPDGSYAVHKDGYFMVSDFVAAIKARHADIKVFVAGYPETHPESPSEAFDLMHLERKIGAGADGVLTQFFFDPDVFFRWRDKLEARGVRVPLIPGLLPILSFPKTVELAKKCNASVPGFLHAMFDGVDPDSLDHKLLAMNVLSHQITRLVEDGGRLFHFYTMNDTLLTRHLCAWLRAGF